MNKKQKNVLIRISISTILLIILGITDHISNIQWYIMLPLYLIPYFTIGYDVLYKSIRNIRNGQVFDENFLMSIATIGAIATKQFPEAVFVMLFYQIGEFFQSWAVNKSRKSISSLIDIRPEYANIEKDNQLVRVDPYEVEIDDIIIIKPGEKIPLDGVIIDGNTSINTVALTGEAVPKDATVGDNVISGCVNLNGLIKVKVTSEFEDSTVSKILELIEDSSTNKAVSEDFITKFAKYYTPIVVISALILAIIPPLFIGNFKEWFMRALTFLVISCPCALVISIPLSFFGGIGAASRRGILVKGSCYLEDLSKCEIAVFDKTGTLTQGSFTVTQINPKNITEDELLRYCALAENNSNHPIALSVKKYYSKEIDSSLIKEYNEIIGLGIKANVEGHIVLAGNSKLMDKNNIEYEKTSIIGTVLYIAIDGVYKGNIVISDTIKETSYEAIRNLNDMNCKTVMLTGDRSNIANKIGNELNLNEIHSELLPTDKVRILENLLKSKTKAGKLLFSGDGINDAPVLARADIGIAMGGIGSDASIEAADIVIMDDNLCKICDAIKISKKTLSIVKQNIIFALGIKILFLILGAVGISNLWMAVFADVGVSFIAILNSMRTLKTK